jgi:hypothetical protein
MLQERGDQLHRRYGCGVGVPLGERGFKVGRSEMSGTSLIKWSPDDFKQPPTFAMSDEKIVRGLVPSGRSRSVRSLDGKVERGENNLEHHG